MFVDGLRTHLVVLPKADHFSGPLSNLSTCVVPTAQAVTAQALMAQALLNHDDIIGCRPFLVPSSLRRLTAEASLIDRPPSRAIRSIMAPHNAVDRRTWQHVGLNTGLSLVGPGLEM